MLANSPSDPAADRRYASALVLAAGGAIRFGGPKLLAPLRGRPLVAHVLDIVVRARTAGIVSGAAIVHAANDAALAALADAAGVPTIAESCT